MSDRRDGERSAMEVLAASFVITAGLLICTFVITGFSHQPGRDFTIMLAWFAGVILIVFLLRDEKDANQAGWLKLWFLTKRTPDLQTPEYRPRRRSNRAKNETMPLAGNEPPSVDSIREARDASLNTWVPTKKPGGKSTPAP